MKWLLARDEIHGSTLTPFPHVYGSSHSLGTWPATINMLGLLFFLVHFNINWKTISFSLRVHLHVWYAEICTSAGPLLSTFASWSFFPPPFLTLTEKGPVSWSCWRQVSKRQEPGNWLWDASISIDNFADAGTAKCNGLFKQVNLFLEGAPTNQPYLFS